MKMKEFEPPGGGARPWRPPLDPPMQIHLRAVMLCRNVKGGKITYTHIFAYNFLNIQLIFNLQKV